MVIHGRIARAALATLLFSAPLAVFAQKQESGTLEPESIPGQFLVRMSDRQSLSSDIAIQSLEEQVRGKILRVHAEQNFALIQKPVIQSMDSQMQDLAATPGVELIEPNYIYRVKKMPNDPDFQKLWGLSNLGQADSTKQMGISGTDIDAVRAWDITTGSKDVVVAVIDTGIDYTHPDLINNAWVNEAELNGQAGVDDDNNGIVDDIHGASFADPKKPTGNPMDDHGHGSHCSGTIGGQGDDGKGIVGVNWNVRVMGVKFLGADGSGSLEGAIQAIDYATKMGAKVLSNSWAGGSYSRLLEEAIQRSKTGGSLFVAAASNEGTDNDASAVYPAGYQVDTIVSVAAVDNRGNLADFSNYGKTTVHIAAPGVNIYSSLPGAAYDSWSGTSMATPHVSGVAALLLAADASLTPEQLKARLLAGAKPLAALRGKVSTGGVLNAYYSLTGTTPPADPNDPAVWASQPYAVSSLHPYARKSAASFEISIPGASQIAVHFAKFQLERGYDFVQFFDKAGNKIGSMSGTQDGNFSPVIAGDFVRMVLESDNSAEKYGFDVDSVSYR